MDTFQVDTIRGRLLELAVLHKNADDQLDGPDADMIEQEAEDLIVAYCESKGYLINGFPTERKHEPIETLDEDYFCRERYQLYLDLLAVEKEDVATLMWSYVSAFWPDQFDSREEYLQSIKNNLASGVFYDIDL